MNNAGDKLTFADAPKPRPVGKSSAAWKVLIVDDDEEVHRITQLVLSNFSFAERSIELMDAYSAKEGKALIKEHPDTALVLLDVVMETDHAGLEVVQYIREELDNQLVRIVLRTGQAGLAPENQIITQYDINDFKDKSELTADKFYTLMHSALRAYRDLEESARRQEAESDLFFSLVHFSKKEVTLEECLDRFLCAACKMCGTSAGYVYFPDNDEQILKAKQFSYSKKTKQSVFSELTDQNQADAALTQFVEEVFKSQKASFYKGNPEDHWLQSMTGVAHEKIVGVFAVPVQRYDKTVALPTLFIADSRAHLPSLVTIIETAALQLGVLLERQQAEHELKNQFQELEDTLQRLKEAQTQIVQSEKMASLGLFAAGVAHEINNPVGFVLSNINTLSNYLDAVKRLLEQHNILIDTIEAGNSETTSLMLNRIKKVYEDDDIEFILDDLQTLLVESADGMGRIRDIVANLKSFARVDEGTISEANINDCIESTLKIVWNELKCKCKLKKDLGDLPLLYCFPGQLNQAFMSIIVNAAHSIVDQGEIHIKTYLQEETIVITISDTGCGIPPENIDILFNPFFTTKPVGEGTGLGLSISYGIIKKHGGVIDVKSTVGQGTTFTIHLPLNNTDENQGSQDLKE